MTEIEGKTGVKVTAQDENVPEAIKSGLSTGIIEDNPTPAEQKNTNIPEESINNVKKAAANMPVVLAGYNGFTPSPLMRMAVWCYAACPGLTLHAIVVGLGHHGTNVWQWRQLTGWREWFDKALSEILQKDILQRFHVHLADLAVSGSDASVMKLFMQRFDSQYTERSSTDSKHTFAGFLPANGQPSADKSVKRLAEHRRSQAALPDTGATSDNKPNDSTDSAPVLDTIDNVEDTAHTPDLDD